MIPLGAKPIIEARAKGLRPADMVLISFIGRIGEPNPTVYATPGRAYEWSWLHGLNACIYVTSGLEWINEAKSMAMARPKYLGVWDAGRREGSELWIQPALLGNDEKTYRWSWDLQYMPWTAIENWRFECD